MEDTRSLHEALNSHGIYALDPVRQAAETYRRKELWSLEIGFLGYFDSTEGWRLIRKIEER